MQMGMGEKGVVILDNIDKSDLQKYIGAKIRSLRVKKKMTQEELGDLLGLKHNSISAIERGVNSFDANTIYSITKIFGIKVDELYPHFDNEQSDSTKEMPDLSVEDIQFFKQVMQKTLSLGEKEREHLVGNIKYMVDYYEKING